MEFDHLDAAVGQLVHEFGAIAHADYSTGARIVVTELKDRVILENDGGFIDGLPEDYLLADRTPRRYRNPFLVDAMTELNMIDHMGYGIQQIHQSQRKRFLPLPDYDLSRGAVRLTIYGAELNGDYGQLLMSRPDLPLGDVVALDRVQENQPLPVEAVARLRRAGLIEGRTPNLRVTSRVAAATGNQAEFIRTRSQEKHYALLIRELLSEYGHATRHEIDDVLAKSLPEALTEQQRRSKVSNLLTKMRRAGEIRNCGTQQKPRWELVYHPGRERN
ncbi:ATP-binding protein [Pseudactinotalea sp. HY158]|uniref:ATP-binding protein n=1 Tax=Pseudactinotalea sp. HY158 TaxID=2654547 RepID=UPI00129D0B47|nr:ATP-binding protein [Pseudactinotalea sp. HY158]QGH68219.1 hypothetical protein GCE65_00810 [Pseudactinotalea sp. HY158]